MPEDADTDRQGARMALDPDTVHESDDGPALDCPACGSTVSLTGIIEEGHCPGSVDADAVEVESEDEQLRERTCTADLSLELVWTE
jgi:hypothetical protein